MAIPVGPDYADIDGNGTIDFDALRKAGARFVSIQGVYGRPANGQSPVYRDAVWKRDAPSARRAGLKVAPYLFLCVPNKGRVTPDPEVQVDAFADYCAGDLQRDVDWAPFFDVEEASDKLSSQDYYAWIVRAYVRLMERFGCVPNMYTSGRVWGEYLKHHAPGPLLHCALWLAKPWPWLDRTPVHMDGAPAYSPILIPEWGTQWFLYQYQGDARGWAGHLFQADASRFRVFGKGAKGNHVIWAQERLRASVAPELKVDGDFGAQTLDAVMRLQQLHQLYPDGFIGPETFAPLCWIIPAGAVVGS